MEPKLTLIFTRYSYRDFLLPLLLKEKRYLFTWPAESVEVDSLVLNEPDKLPSHIDLKECVVFLSSWFRESYPGMSFKDSMVISTEEAIDDIESVVRELVRRANKRFGYKDFSKNLHQKQHLVDKLEKKLLDS